MKKLFFYILMLNILANTAKGQSNSPVMVSKPQNFLTYILVQDSIKTSRGYFSGILQAPADTTANKLGIAQVGYNLYVGNGIYWSLIIAGSVSHAANADSLGHIAAASYLKYSDTTTQTSGYLRKGWGVYYTDTASMLSNRLKYSDSAFMLSNYRRKTTVIQNSDLAYNSITVQGVSIFLGGSGTILNLTTTGTSGAATLSGTTLNIPTPSGTGTVTTFSLVTANGFAGTVANASTTPTLTLTTTITGLLKGNGTSISAATAGTDYLAPSATFNLGTTALALNRASTPTALTGITSIDGSAAKWTTARTISTGQDIAWTVTVDGSSNQTSLATVTGIQAKPITLATGYLKYTGSAWSFDNSTFLTSGTGVTTFSAGTTGLTPSSGTSGAITLSGTLIATNGGTGYTSLSSLAGDAAFTGAFQAKATNLTSLSALSYASTSFVKMTAAGTFALDVNTYLTTSSASSTYLNLSGSNANQNIGIGSYSFTAGAIYSSVSSGNNINIDKSGGGAINFTRSSVQHFLLEDDNNGIGFYYGSSPVLGATIGANATFASSVTASSFIGGSFSGTTGNFSSTVTGSGFNGASLTGTGLFLSSSQLQMLGGAASLYLDMTGGFNRISSTDSYDYFFNMSITGDSHNTGFEIQRNKVSGSYNTDWTIRLTTNNTDLQFANGGTSVMALATTGKLTLTNIEVLKGYTVSGLPAGVTGAWAYVTDASGPTYGATVVGGGSVVTPVFYNGSNWTCR